MKGQLDSTGGDASAAPDADMLFALARDHDRWGLAPEAEAFRHESRAARVRDLVRRSLSGAPGARLERADDEV